MRHPKPLVEIVSTGRYLPEHELTNEDLAKRVDTSDEWIRSRTGIGARRVAHENQGAAAMGARTVVETLGAAIRAGDSSPDDSAE